MLNQLLIQDWNYYFSRDRRKIRFTKNTELHISCCAVSRHIYISPNKVVHCRAACAYSPEFLRSLKIFRDCRGKGNTRDRSVIGENSRFISAKTHFSIHRSGIARPTLIEFSLRYAYQREARMCVRAARARSRPRANACTLVIILHTHVRVVRGVVLRPPSFPLNVPPAATLSPLQLADQPVSLPLTSPARLPTVLHVVPTRTICFIAVTWSPPFRSLLSPHPSDVTRSLTILCSRH